MKVAHLILAHAQPIQLKRLIDKLSHEDAYCFVHVDLNVQINIFTELFITNERVFFISERVAIKWASYSLVQATINGFKAIKSAGLNIEYVNLLSGQDYPLKPINEFHEFLTNHPNKAFMHCLDVHTEWTEAVLRLEQYHFTYYREFTGKYKLQRLLNKLVPKRKMPENMIAVGRSQWFTIAFVQMEYLVKKMEQSKRIAHFFKLTWAPDEIIFQTLLFNSNFKLSIINDNLRYIDWSQGEKNPKLLVTEDYRLLMNSNCFFARKFDLNIDANILDLIDQASDSKSQ